MPPRYDQRNRMRQYRRERKNFSCKVYIYALIFALLALLQWLLMIFIEDFGKAMVDLFFLSIIGLLVSLTLITMFIFMEDLRFSTPCNFILAIAIVEGVVFGLSIIVVKSKADLFGICFGVALAVTILFIIIGVAIPHDLTIDVVVLFVLSIIFFFGAVLFVMLYILVMTKYTLYIFSVFVIATTLMFLMYHAQTINGHRYAEMRVKDYLLAALIIYHDFVILMAIFFYLMSLCTGKGAFSVNGCNSDTMTTTTAAPAAEAGP